MELYSYDCMRIEPSQQLPLHKQDTWELIYIVTGKGMRILGDSQTGFSEGELAFIPPNIPHQWSFDPYHLDQDGMVCYLTLTFRTEFVDRFMSTFPELTERLEALKSTTSVLSFDNETTLKIGDMLTKMQYEDNIERIPYIFRLFLLMTSDRTRPHVIGNPISRDRTTQRVNKIKEYTTSHYSRPITIDMIAEYVGMNRSSFCTFFKKATGQTYITYLNKLRVDRACFLLRQGRFTVTEVCNMVGFNDVPYFNRCFKNFRGISPKEYMEGTVTNRQIIKAKKPAPMRPKKL